MATLDFRSGSLLVKSLLIGILTLLTLWPLAQVEQLVGERQERRAEAYGRIARSYGGAQTLGGPVLSVAIEERAEIDVGPGLPVRLEWKGAAPRLLLPETLDIDARVDVDVRRKGIYRFPVYRTTVTLAGEFAPGTLAALLDSGTEAVRTVPGRAALKLPLTGLTSLRSVARFELDGVALRPVGGELAGLAALHVPLNLAALDRTRALPYRIELTLGGSDALRFLPLGTRTRVNLRSTWPHPDFDGAFLPINPVAPTASGFKAGWSVLGLNRALPQIGRAGEYSSETLLATAFGFRLLQPAEVYARTYRAVRYGVLFVAVTFLCFFAWEALSRRVRLHPMQYLLVGLSLATFYLLLLALAEHLGFELAYAIAAAVLVALITIYVAGAAASWRGGLAIGGALTAAYGALYAILLSEDYALLLGALLVFAVLAILMLATRSLDWAGVGGMNRA